MNSPEKTNSIIRSYVRLCAFIFLILLVVIPVAEYFIFKDTNEGSYIYKIEINRLESELEEKALADIDISRYKSVRGVFVYDERESLDSFLESDESYVVRYIDGKIYRIEYDEGKSDVKKNRILIINLALLLMVGVILFFLVYIYFAIIRNFNALSEYPFELSKGNLTAPLMENKNRYFGRFLWGLDMLREKLGQEKQQNMHLQKEKNVFLLSLSHDIKTPLAAIKLYAAALKKNLYTEPDKLKEVAEKIDKNTTEIESYVSKIISASREDFLDLKVNEGEFYLSRAMNTVESYYKDKLSAIGTEFKVEGYSDVLLKGDCDRLVEVFQNIIENAIKYGDGKSISVSFSDEEGARLVSISNTGCYLKPEEEEHIFDSFYRGSNVGNRPGSGLGLYICKKLMNAMKGDIYETASDGVMKMTVVCSKA